MPTFTKQSNVIVAVNNAFDLAVASVFEATKVKLRAPVKDDDDQATKARAQAALPGYHITEAEFRLLVSKAYGHLAGQGLIEGSLTPAERDKARAAKKNAKLKAIADAKAEVDAE